MASLKKKNKTLEQEQSRMQEETVTFDIAGKNLKQCLSTVKSFVVPQNVKNRPGTVVHPCNPSYSGS
jgi:hypothetical protein